QLDAQRCEQERLETEQRDKARLEAEQRKREGPEAEQGREEQKQMERESQLPPLPVVSSTSSRKTKLRPVARIRTPIMLSCAVTLLVLIIGLFVGVSIYFGSHRPLTVPPAPAITSSPGLDHANIGGRW